MTNRELVPYVREQFPALKNEFNGFPLAYLDGPGGYQVPMRVIQAMENYLIHICANSEGSYRTSVLNDEMIHNSRMVFAEFFNCSWREVVFGPNMTSLCFFLAQSLMRDLRLGDHVLITEIDHEANRSPWLQLRERGIIVDEARIDTEKCILDLTDLKRKLTSKTKIVAFNYASNAVGTINDVAKIVSIAHDFGALTVVDAVHYAAHGPIDVQATGTDVLICSAYKFFGPHIGVMYINKDLFDRMRPLRVRAARAFIPYKSEIGTLNHEGIAGAAEAVRFVADVGGRFGSSPQLADASEQRSNIVAGLLAFKAYEDELTDYLASQLAEIDGVSLFGPPAGYPRTSTISFTLKGYNSRIVAQYLDSKGLLVWDGDFFATTLIERLGLVDQGGLVRIGIAPYNTRDELERVVSALRDKPSLEHFAAG